MKEISISYQRKSMKVEIKFIHLINIYCGSSMAVLGIKRKGLVNKTGQKIKGDLGR